MDPISISGTIITVLQLTSSVISKCYNYRQGIGSSASSNALKITKALNELEDVSEALLRTVERASQEGAAQFAAIKLLAKENGVLEHCVTVLGALEGGLGAGKEGGRKEWPFDEGKIERIEEELNGVVGTMRLALTACQATMTLAIQDDIQDLSRLFQRFSSDDTRHGLFRWIASCSPHANHASTRERHVHATGRWLLGSNPFEIWLHSPQSFMWLYGLPGAGKTMLCSTIIENLIRATGQDKNKAMVYFYFDFNDGGRITFSALLQSLVTQLSLQCDTLPPALLEIYKAHQESTKLIDDVALTKLFRELVLSFQEMYIIVDALNESNEVDQVVELMQAIQDWKHPNLHLAVTSRQLPEIEASLRDLVTNKVCLHEAGMKEDIGLYIDEKFRTDKKLSKWPADIKSQIKLKLLEAKCGMFQWVVCQFDMLQRAVSMSAIRQKLSIGFPDSLDQTYDNIWLSIEEGHQPEALKTLGALAVTVEPLQLTELVELLAIDFRSKPPRLQVDARLMDPKRIATRCSSFVTMAKAYHQGFYGHQEPASVLRLAHVSVAEYVFQANPTGPMQYHFSRLSARQFLAQACLAYLLSPQFSKGYAVDYVQKRQACLTKEDKAHLGDHIKETLELFPFLRHAVKYWPYYLKRERGDPVTYLESRTKELLLAFFDTRKLPNGGNFTFWVGVLNSNHPLDYIKNTQPLYYASSFGLAEVVRMLLEREKDIDVNALGGRSHSTALHVSTFRDHMDIVKMLLEKGADPNIPNDDNESPLFWAEANGDKEMQELLLQHGAKPLK